MQATHPLHQLIAQIRECLQRSDHERLPELVRQYLDQMHAVCTHVDVRPAPEPLRHLLAEQQQVLAQMRQQQQALAHAIASRRHGEHAARTYRSASA